MTLVLYVLYVQGVHPSGAVTGVIEVGERQRRKECRAMEAMEGTEEVVTLTLTVWHGMRESDSGLLQK